MTKAVHHVQRTLDTDGDNSSSSLLSHHLLRTPSLHFPAVLPGSAIKLRLGELFFTSTLFVNNYYSCLLTMVRAQALLYRLVFSTTLL